MSLAVTSVGTRRLLDPVLAVMFPCRCPACGDSVTRPTRGPLCVRCWGALPKHDHPACRCGFSLPEGVRGLCGRCRRGLTPFAAGASLGPFEGSLRILIHELQYQGHRRVAARMLSMRQAGCRKVIRGITTAEEVLRVTQQDEMYEDLDVEQSATPH